MDTNPDPDFVSEILAIYGLSEDVRDVITAPESDPWRAREKRYRDALPGRMADAADGVNERFAGLLPEGVRFEWAAG